jgi:rubrerythrin
MLKDLAIRTVTSSRWRGSNARLASSLERFADVEADSGWQMLRALDATSDPEFRTKLFNNAVEEMHHAELFRSVASELAPFPLPAARERRREIFTPKRGLPWFAAYHFTGENDVFHQFSAYADAAPPNSALRHTFLQIRGDEAQHRELAYRELCRLAASEAKAKALIRRVKGRRIFETWKRFGEHTVALFSSIILNVIYFIAGPLLASSARRHFQR